MVKRGADYVSIKAEDIAYFYVTHKMVCMVAKNGQKYILDQSLSDFEKQTDPALFYRVIRKYLINLKSIKRIKSQPKSKLLLEVEPLIAVVIISGENAAGFKKWLEQ